MHPNAASLSLKGSCPILFTVTSPQESCTSSHVSITQETETHDSRAWVAKRAQGRGARGSATWPGVEAVSVGTQTDELFLMPCMSNAG